MARLEFITVPEKLWSLAARVSAELSERGYAVKVEPRDISLPGTPAFLAKRGHECLYVLVVEKPNFSEINRWVRYCHSSSSDTRVGICVESVENTPQSEVVKFEAIGVGLCGMLGEAVHWPSAPRDLAFHAQLPERKDLLPAVRRQLGEALDRFDQRDWRMGFESACLVLEDESRSYLLRNVDLGRVKYTKGSKVIAPTKAQIKRMTLGSLAVVFCNLLRQNQIEARVCATLDALNPSRIHRIHKARKKGSESVLRRKVGIQMWAIINALSELSTT